MITYQGWALFYQSSGILQYQACRIASMDRSRESVAAIPCTSARSFHIRESIVIFKKLQINIIIGFSIAMRLYLREIYLPIFNMIEV